MVVCLSGRDTEGLYEQVNNSILFVCLFLLFCFVFHVGAVGRRYL